MTDMDEPPSGLDEERLQQRQGLLSELHSFSASATCLNASIRRSIAVGSLACFLVYAWFLQRNPAHHGAQVRGSTSFVQLEIGEPAEMPTYPYSAWSGAIKEGTCSTTSSPLAIEISPKMGTAKGKITCALENGSKIYRFPPGIFEIDEQLLVLEHSGIVGANDPNNLMDPLQQPAWDQQTVFVATRGVTDYNMNYCYAPNMVTTRVGFVLSSYTSVMNVNYQGLDIIRPNDNGGLCGGAAFETKGCAQNDCGASDVNNGGSDGMCSQHVNIANVRLNAFYWHEDQHLVGANVPGNYNCGSNNFGGECCFCKPNNIRSTQVGIWVPQCRSPEGTQDVTISSVVALSTQADGINLHGKINNAKVTSNYFQNAGDDIYALWGAGLNPTNILFKDSVAVNPGILRPNWYGVCVATYGLQSVTFENMKCKSPMLAHPISAPGGGPVRIDTSMFVFYTSFGASYPAGHTVTLNGWTFTNLKDQAYTLSTGSVNGIAPWKMVWTKSANNVAAPYYVECTQHVHVVATPP